MIEKKKDDGRRPYHPEEIERRRAFKEEYMKNYEQGNPFDWTGCKTDKFYIFMILLERFTTFFNRNMHKGRFRTIIDYDPESEMVNIEFVELLSPHESQDNQNEDEC